MGEIGFNRHEFLYDLKMWEVRSIVRGYNKRSRYMWSATRWQTYQIMSAQVGGKALAEAGIHSPMDLLKFPWDKEPAPPITQDEVKDIQAEIRALNGE